MFALLDPSRQIAASIEVLSRQYRGMITPIVIERVFKQQCDALAADATIVGFVHWFAEKRTREALEALIEQRANPEAAE